MSFKIIIIAISLFLPTLATAAIYSGPIGEQEAYLANAGAALEGSSGGLILNPAGLSFTKREAPSVSVSGNTMGFEQTRSPGFYKSSTSFSTRTLLAAGVFPTWEWDGYFAFFYSEPIDETSISRSVTNDGITNTANNFEINSNTTTGGIAVGVRPWENLGFGISGSVGFHIRDSYRTIAQSSGALTSLTYEREQIKNYYVLLTPGLLWRVEPWWNLGFSVNWRPFSLQQQGLLYRANQSSAGMDLSETGIPFEPDIKNNWDVTLGQSFMLSEKYLLLLDLSYSPEISYKNEGGERLTDESFKSVSLAMKVHRNSLIDLLGGYSRTESYHSKSNLVTFGFAVNRANSSLLLGLYYKDNTIQGDRTGQMSSGGFTYSGTVSYF